MFIRKKTLKKWLKELIMKNVLIVVFAIVLLAAGCQEEQRNPKYKPLNQLIPPARQDWKDTYGDTLQTQMMFNLALLHFNNIEIAKAIRGNQVATNMRLDQLEPDPNVPEMEKFDRMAGSGPGGDANRRQRLRWEWKYGVIDKLDEIVDWINKQ